MKRFLTAIGLFLTLLGATGCNTFEGFGKDVEEAGDAVEDATDGQ